MKKNSKIITKEDALIASRYMWKRLNRSNPRIYCNEVGFYTIDVYYHLLKKYAIK